MGADAQAGRGKEETVMTEWKDRIELLVSTADSELQQYIEQLTAREEASVATIAELRAGMARVERERDFAIAETHRWSDADKRDKAERDTLEAENARLRAALEKIGTLTVRFHPIAGWMVDECDPRNIARAALGQGAGK